MPIGANFVVIRRAHAHEATALGGAVVVSLSERGGRGRERVRSKGYLDENVDIAIMIITDMRKKVEAKSVAALVH